MTYHGHLAWGWNDFLESFFETHLLEAPDDLAARVIREERGLYQLVLPSLEALHWAQISGAFQFEAKTREDYPAVGDWVTVNRPASERDRLRISGLLPRKSCLMRQAAGTSKEVQIFAAQIDEVFIVTSCNRDYSERRLDRALALVQASRARARILLSKIDLISEEELARFIRQIEKRFPGVPYAPFSSRSTQGLEEIRSFLKENETYVVLGSSGVGKSTLLNVLMGEEVQRVQEIRDDDQKGKHTTVSRSLHKIAGGALIIDTPGIRELQMIDNDEALNQSFEDLSQLSLACRFSDCRHRSEPGCRIQGALASGELGQDRWESYLKLQAEMAFQARKSSKALMSEEKRKWAKRGANAQEVKRFLKKY